MAYFVRVPLINVIALSETKIAQSASKTMAIQYNCCIQSWLVTIVNFTLMGQPLTESVKIRKLRLGLVRLS